MGPRRCGKLGWLKDKEVQGVGEEHADISGGKAVNKCGFYLTEAKSSGSTVYKYEKSLH